MTERHFKVLEKIENYLINRGICQAYIRYDEDGKVDTPVQYLKKIKQLERVLISDLIASDALWCIFVAAVKNYSQNETVLSDLPKFIGNIEQLLILINETPNFRSLRTELNNKNYFYCEKPIIKLLHWILIDFNGPKLGELRSNAFLEIMATIQQNSEIQIPLHAFKLNYPTDSTEEKVFRERSQIYGTKYAFIGCDVDTLFSILCLGFKSVYNATTNRMHLVNELSIILKDQPRKPCWEKSCCGQIYRIVCFCEFINREEYIKSTFDGESQCARIFITLPDIVRIRYLFYYSEDIKTRQVVDQETLKQWLLKRKDLVFGCSVVLFSSFAYTVRNSLRIALSFTGRNVRHLIHSFNELFRI